MWAGINKRKFPRANYKCTIFIKRPLLSRHIKTFTENIGIGGICVIVKYKLNNFDEVNLKLALDDGLPPIECSGKVVWKVKRELPTKKVLYDTGIEFVGLKPENRQRIEKAIEGIRD